MARGDLIIVDFPIPSGQAGHEQVGSRPALALQSDEDDSFLPTTMIIPFTSNVNATRFPYTILVDPSSQNGLTTQSVLLVFQLRAIDKKRIVRSIGKLENTYIEHLNNELKNLLGI